MILPTRLQGDGPCSDCGTEDNIVWFTDSPLWNGVIRPRGEVDADPFLCIPCFIVRVDRAGYWPTGWQLIPAWPWRFHGENGVNRWNKSHGRGPDRESS